MFSNIWVGAGSSAEFTLPHFPTVDSTSGIFEIRLSSIAIYSRFCSIPVCGIVVGISKNDPSFRLGINSCPSPGKRLSADCHKSVCLNDLHPTVSNPFATTENVLSKPSHITIPNSTVTIGKAINFHLLAKLHLSIGS